MAFIRASIPARFKHNLTDWIAGIHKPVRDGVYIRRYISGDFYCKFKDSVWGCGFSNVRNADYYDYKSPHQELPWKGLNEQFN